MSDLYIGIDFGGTNLKAGLFDADMKLIAATSVPSGDLNPEAVVENMAKTAEKLASDAGFALSDIKGVGVGCPGQINLTDGVVLSSPNIGFENVPLRKMLNDRFGIPAVLENDANAAAWGEFVLGAAKDVQDLVFFTLGTGIGGGIVSDGKLVYGCSDEAAELGHIIMCPDSDRTCGCGQKGCAEAYASANSTADRAKEAVVKGQPSTLKDLLDKNGEITCKDVFDHAAAGDKLAQETVDGTARILALLCVNMLHITQPKRILFAGGMIAAGDALLGRIKHYFDQYIWTMKKEDVEICFATLGEDAGITGTAALAKQAAG